MDSYTVSELVRLHLLGSGFERLQETARFDYQQRGGYDSVDDPALDFRCRDMTILKMLAETSIFNLSPGNVTFIDWPVTLLKLLCVNQGYTDHNRSM